MITFHSAALWTNNAASGNDQTHFDIKKLFHFPILIKDSTVGQNTQTNAIPFFECTDLIKC